MMANPHSLVEGVDHRVVRDPREPRLHLRARRGRHVLRRLQAAVAEAYAAGYLGKDIHGSGFDLDLVVHAGAGAYICGEETALLDSLEGRRGQPRLRPPFPAVAGLYACPTVVNNVESIASVPPIVLNGADWFRSMGTREVPGLHALLAVRPRHQPRASTRRRSASRCASCSTCAGGMRAGHAAEVLDAGRLVDAAAHRRAPRRAARLRGRRRGRLDARHQGAADLRRDHLRGARGAALDRVLQARVLRQVHAVPRGHLLAGADPATPRDGRGHRGRPREAARHLRQHPRPRRSARSATAPTSPITSSIKYFRDEYLAHLEPAAARSTRTPRRCSPTDRGGCLA